jgi:hypothetical protein
MRNKFLVFFATIALFCLSCSEDNDNGGTATILGKWYIDSVKLGGEPFDYGTAGCPTDYIDFSSEELTIATFSNDPDTCEAVITNRSYEVIDSKIYFPDTSIEPYIIVSLTAETLVLHISSPGGDSENFELDFTFVKNPN